MDRMDQLKALIERYKRLGIDSQIDYERLVVFVVDFEYPEFFVNLADKSEFPVGIQIKVENIFSLFFNSL